MSICNDFSSAIDNESCYTNANGVFELYVINREYVAELTSSNLSSPAGIITSMSLTSPQKFKQIKFRVLNDGTTLATAVQTQTKDANGNNYFTSTLTIRLYRQEQAINNALAPLISDERYKVITRDGNGKYWYHGDKNGLSWSLVNATQDDTNNNYNLTGTGSKELEMAREIDSSLIASIVTTA